MRPLRRRLLGLGVVIAVVAAIAFASRHHLRGASLIVRSLPSAGWLGRMPLWPNHPFTEQDTSLASRHGSLRARLYRPSGPIRRSVVLAPGVHALGIDEPRLVSFARNLAALGLAVVTPELPDLRQYRITPRSTDMIEDAAAGLAQRPEWAPDGRVGVIGISFAGGLSIVAAGRPLLRDHTAFAMAFGGHGDLPRVLRFLCTGVQPDGVRRTPHDYGVVIILLSTLDRVVPPDQAEGLRTSLLTFLEASHLAMFDRKRALETFARVRQMEKELPEPSATLLRNVSERNVAALGAALLPHIDEFGNDPALSAERSEAPRAPVHLLHGLDDNVIPAIESTLLAEHLRSRTSVRCVISPLITHAEINRQARFRDVWNLIGFWADVFAE
jgi:dienelactone hydrolase